VVYIRHIIHDLPTDRLLFGYSIAGTEGAELYGGLEVVPGYRFDKHLGDALSNRALVRLIREKGYDALRLCGLDECGCVARTALGCARRGIRATIVGDGTATVLPERKRAAMYGRLRAAGIPFE
jgi:nicotinamidase-related amidase